MVEEIQRDVFFHIRPSSPSYFNAPHSPRDAFNRPSSREIFFLPFPPLSRPFSN
jgi:hypothetical protein